MVSDFALVLVLVVGHLEAYKGFARYDDLQFFTGRSRSYLRAYVSWSDLFVTRGRPAEIRLSESGRMVFEEARRALSSLCNSDSLNSQLECLRRLVGRRINIGGRSVRVTQRVLKKEKVDLDAVVLASSMMGGLRWNELRILDEYSEYFLTRALLFARRVNTPAEKVVALSRLMNPQCVEPENGGIYRLYRPGPGSSYVVLVEQLKEPEKADTLEALGVAKRVAGRLVPLDIPRLLAKRARGRIDKAVAKYVVALRSAMRRAPPRRDAAVREAYCWDVPLCHRLEDGGIPLELLPAEDEYDEEYRFWLVLALNLAREYDLDEAYREARALYVSGAVRGEYAQRLSQAPRRAQWLVVLALAAANETYPEPRGDLQEYLLALYKQALKRD
ncbi:MAG: hypothetical protein QXI84_07585 [Thermofilaceae archaeon]